MIETLIKSKVTPEDVFLGSEPPSHLDFQSQPHLPWDFPGSTKTRIPESGNRNGITETEMETETETEYGIKYQW